MTALLVDIAQEVCGNPKCGSIVDLDMRVQVPEGTNLDAYTWPVFYCMGCGHHTQVMTQKHHGPHYGGSYMLAYPTGKHADREDLNTYTPNMDDE